MSKSRRENWEMTWDNKEEEKNCLMAVKWDEGNGDRGKLLNCKRELK